MKAYKTIIYVIFIIIGMLCCKHGLFEANLGMGYGLMVGMFYFI